MILLGLAGSFAYGMNIDTSDIDVRKILFHTVLEENVGPQFCGSVYISRHIFRKGLLKIGQRLYSSIDRIG